MSCWLKMVIPAMILLIAPQLSISQETRIVNYRAESIVRDERLFDGMKRLIGSVFMQHEELQLTCDSAHLDEKTNRFIGFGRVHIIKADTIHIHARKIDYSGQNEKARLEGKIRMENGSAILYTEMLDYDMKEDVAWYFGGGQIIDPTNTVESYWGYYHVDRNEFIFRDQVVLSNDESTLLTDTLRYLSQTEEMWFSGFTEIYGDTNYISCQKGYYDSRISYSSFQNKVFMQSAEQILRGDSLTYFRDSGDTEVFSAVEMQDTLEKITIRGEKLSYNDLSGWFRMSEEVYFILADQSDSLFLFSDTLISIRDTISKSRHIKAFPRVSFYRQDIQGRCKRLDYLVNDSLIRMFDDPVIWQDSTQLTADSIQVRLAEKGIKYMKLEGNGFMVIQEDSTLFNQIKGKLITGWFSEDQLDWVDVTGNGETLFFPPNEDDIIGMNRVTCSNIRIWFKEGKLHDLRFYTEIEPKLTPMKDVIETEKVLEGFRWQADSRPKDREDIRNWR